MTFKPIARIEIRYPKQNVTKILDGTPTNGQQYQYLSNSNARMVLFGLPLFLFILYRIHTIKLEQRERRDRAMARRSVSTLVFFLTTAITIFYQQYPFHRNGMRKAETVDTSFFILLSLLMLPFGTMLFCRYMGIIVAIWSMCANVAVALMSLFLYRMKDPITVVNMYFNSGEADPHILVDNAKQTDSVKSNTAVNDEPQIQDRHSNEHVPRIQQVTIPPLPWPKKETGDNAIVLAEPNNKTNENITQVPSIEHINNEDVPKVEPKPTNVKNDKRTSWDQLQIPENNRKSVSKHESPTITKVNDINDHISFANPGQNTPRVHKKLRPSGIASIESLPADTPTRRKNSYWPIGESPVTTSHTILPPMGPDSLESNRVKRPSSLHTSSEDKYAVISTTPAKDKEKITGMHASFGLESPTHIVQNAGTKETNVDLNQSIPKEVIVVSQEQEPITANKSVKDLNSGKNELVFAELAGVSPVGATNKEHTKSDGHKTGILIYNPLARNTTVPSNDLFYSNKQLIPVYVDNDKPKHNENPSMQGHVLIGKNIERTNNEPLISPRLCSRHRLANIPVPVNQVQNNHEEILEQNPNAGINRELCSSHARDTQRNGGNLSEITNQHPFHECKLWQSSAQPTNVDGMTYRSKGSFGADRYAKEPLLSNQPFRKFKNKNILQRSGRPNYSIYHEPHQVIKQIPSRKSGLGDYEALHEPNMAKGLDSEGQLCSRHRGLRDYPGNIIRRNKDFNYKLIHPRPIFPSYGNDSLGQDKLIVVDEQEYSHDSKKYFTDSDTQPKWKRKSEECGMQSGKGMIELLSRRDESEVNSKPYGGAESISKVKAQDGDGEIIKVLAKGNIGDAKGQNRMKIIVKSIVDSRLGDAKELKIKPADIRHSDLSGRSIDISKDYKSVLESNAVPSQSFPDKLEKDLKDKSYKKKILSCCYPSISSESENEVSGKVTYALEGEKHEQNLNHINSSSQDYVNALALPQAESTTADYQLSKVGDIGVLESLDKMLSDVVAIQPKITNKSNVLNRESTLGDSSNFLTAKQRDDTKSTLANYHTISPDSLSSPAEYNTVLSSKSLLHSRSYSPDGLPPKGTGDVTEKIIDNDTLPETLTKEPNVIKHRSAGIDAVTDRLSTLGSSFNRGKRQFPVQHEFDKGESATDLKTILDVLNNEASGMSSGNQELTVKYDDSDDSSYFQRKGRLRKCITITKDKYDKLGYKYLDGMIKNKLIEPDDTIKKDQISSSAGYKTIYSFKNQGENAYTRSYRQILSEGRLPQNSYRNFGTRKKFCGVDGKRTSRQPFIGTVKSAKYIPRGTRSLNRNLGNIRVRHWLSNNLGHKAQSSYHPARGYYGMKRRLTKKINVVQDTEGGLHEKPYWREMKKMEAHIAHIPGSA